MFQRTSNARARNTSTIDWPAPSKGWVQSGNISTAPKDQAEVLDNWIPTAQGARIRGGSTQYADLGVSVVSLFAYTDSTTTLLGGTSTKLFNVDRVSAGANDFAEVEGLGSGDWSSTQISTAGGRFLVAVNGTDTGLYFDGAAFQPLADETITNLGFDAETAGFVGGETLTGGTSGATATISLVTKTSATTGTLRLTDVVGTFQNNEAITSAGGSATAQGAPASGSAITITGVSTSDLSQVWLFKERLFFVEQGTASAWYLPVESVGGAASEINLGSVLRKGGALLFGATWSVDSGSGLDDVCVFVSDQGELVVYEGSNPGDAADWALVGVYDIGKPLNKRAFFKAGGDLAILTEDGIIPISEALRKDRAALQSAAISYPIEDAWKAAIANATSEYPISAALWQSQTVLLIGTPSRAGNLNVSFVANARTGAWARVTGWDVRCSAVARDDLYFGNSDGLVLAADTGGSDNGQFYTVTYVPKFQTFSDVQVANAAGITYRSDVRSDVNLDGFSDYNVGAFPATSPSGVAPWGFGTWGVGTWASNATGSASYGVSVWGNFVWGGTSETISYTEWQPVYATGYALSPGFSLQVLQESKPRFELLAVRMRHEQGYGL